jgi:hypothetical protein
MLPFGMLNHHLLAVLRLAVLCCAVLCCAVLCCAVLCCAVLCCAVLCCAVLCCAVPCRAVLRPCSIASATRRSFDDTSGIRLQPFGSFVNGLSTWNRCARVEAAAQPHTAVVLRLEQ